MNQEMADMLAFFGIFLGLIGTCWFCVAAYFWLEALCGWAEHKWFQWELRNKKTSLDRALKRSTIYRP